MQNDLIFKTGFVKRALGWFVCLASAGALIGMVYVIYTHPENQIPSEIWSAVAIGVFLIGLMVFGIAIQYVRWSIQGENIIYHHLFKNKTIPISSLAGFGEFILIVSFFPLRSVDLYDRDLNHIARLPISLNDWPRAQAWLAERLRYVVNDGMPIRPKYRFADTPKS